MAAFKATKSGKAIAAFEQAAAAKNPGLEFVVGGTAGMVSKTCVAPLTRLAFLLQTQSLAAQAVPKQAAPVLHRPGACQLLMDIWQGEGGLAFWRGNMIVLAHRAVQSGASFVFTGLCKRAWEAQLEGGEPMGKLPKLATSCIGATVAVVITHPVDVVKTRLITERGCGGQRYYGNAANTLRLVLRDEGLRGLYRGLGVSLTATAPTIGMAFFTFDIASGWVTGGQRKPTPMEAGISGAVAGATASTLLFPLDLVKKQMQLMGHGGQRVAYDSTSDALAKIYEVGAIRHGRLFAAKELYRGLTVELMKVVPGVAILFSVNESLHKLLKPLF